MPPTADGDEESRLDRELMELLNELRVALPGVEVLFAFLLTLPFAQRFGDLTRVQRDAYLVAFLSCAGAILFFMATPAFHRMRWREYDKERLLRSGNRWAIVGLCFLAVAIVAVVFLVIELVVSTAFAVIMTVVVAVILVPLWFGLPLMRKARRQNGR